MADVSKKWYNLFPHTDFSEFNMDWIISKYGYFQDSIDKLNEITANHEERITIAESDIDSLESRMDNVESDVDSLKTRMTTAENDIDSLESRMDSTESHIDLIDDEIADINSDIDDLQIIVGDNDSGLVKRMTDAENNITTLDSSVDNIILKNQSQDNDITALDNRVTELESHSVVANDGGVTTGTLAQLKVDGVNYAVPSGGGSGGSSVIPNPSGTPTTDLNSVSIDNVIFAIPTGVDTSDLISDAYDSSHIYSAGDYCIYNDVLYVANDTTTGAFDSSKWDATTCTSEIESVKSEFEDVNKSIIRKAIVGSLTNNNSVQTIPNSSFTFTETGTYLVTAHLSVDSSNFGSTPRYVGFYLRDSDTNIDLDKFTINGNEPAMITQGAELEITKVISYEHGVSEPTLHFASRVYSSATKVYDYDLTFDVIKLNSKYTPFS